jgi:hypothetical protein
MLMIGGAVVVYLLWKKSQKEKTSGFSNAGGGCTNKLHTKCNYVNTNGVCSYGCVSKSACSPCSYGTSGLGATIAGGTTTRTRVRRR